MKKIYFFVLAVLFSFTIKAQVINIGEQQIAYTCNALFYDSGGETGDAGYTDKITTIYSNNGTCLSILFVDFDLGFGASLNIYEGNSVNPVMLIGSFSGINTPQIITAQILTFEYKVPPLYMGNIPGWKAQIKCSQCPVITRDPASDCPGAIPLCNQTNAITLAGQYTNTGSIADEDGGCFSGTGSGGSVWYSFTAQNTGNLTYSIAPSSTADYDFVLYNGDNGCSSNMLPNQLSCNFSMETGTTGLTTNAGTYQNSYSSSSYSGCSGSSYYSANQDCGTMNQSVNATAGQHFFLMINFYSGSNGGFNVDFTQGGGNVIIADQTPPEFTTVTQPGCNGSQIQVSFSENIKCTTMDASDFTIPGYTVTIANTGCANNMTQSVTLNISPALPNGTYTLSGQSMADMCGNLLNDNIQITISTTPVTVTVSGNDFCTGSSSTLTTSVTGVTPYVYTWSDGSHNSSLTVSTAGNYCVTVSDACGSIANDCQIINTISVPVINTSYSCNGSNATLDVTGCTGTIQWQEWGNVPSSTPITNATECTACGGTPSLLFGLYLSCSTGSSCPSTIPGWVNIGTAPSVNVTPPYATQYQAICTGGGGCNAQSIVNVNCATPLSVSVNSATVCAGGCVNITATVSGGTAPFTYAWSVGSLSGAGPHNVCPASTTTYTVTVTDAGGSTTASGIVTVNQLPTVNAGTDVSICTGNTTTITATGASTYLWDNGLGAGSSHTVSPISNTTYSVTGTDASSCTFIDAVTVTVGANLSPSISGNLIICNGSTTTLNAGTGYLSYQWSTGANFQNINVSASGNYSVTVTGTGGCTGIASVNVTVNPCTEICDNGIDDDGDGLIDLNDTTDCNCLGINTTQQSSLIPNHSFEQMDCCPSTYSQTNCATGWIQATEATSDYQNTCGLVFGSVTDAGLVPFPDGNGILGCINASGWQEYVGSCLTQTMTAGNSYEMTFDVATVLMDANGDTPINSILPGGISSLDSINITIYGNPNCGAMPINTYDCPSSADPSWIELGHVSYDPVSQWGLITIVFSPTIDINAIIMGSPCTLPGTWMAATNNYSNYVYTIFDDLMLTETTPHSFTTHTIGNFCNNNLILYAQLSDTLSSYQWQWFKNGVALVGETNDTLYFSQNNYTSGEYEIRLTVNASCEIQSILVNPENMNPQIDYSTTCSGYQVLFSGHTTGAPTPANWQWLIDGNTYNIQNPVVNFTSSGVHNAQLIVQGINSQCVDTDLTTINLLPYLQLDLGIDSICYYSPTTLSATNGFDMYQWSTGDTSLSINISAPGTYVCTVSKINQSNNIINGDFEQGNTGFSSSYIFNGNGVVAGHYGIVSNTAVNDPFWASCQDHTSGTGNMMIVDGADQPNVSVWCQTVNISPNTDYIFNAWVNSIQSNSPAILQFSINGISLNQPFQASSTLCSWNQFYATWNSGINTSANICIVNQSTAIEGNDFALDDIFFGEVCTQTDSVVYLLQPHTSFSANDTCIGLIHQYHDQTLQANGAINSWQWSFGDGMSSVQQNPQHAYINAIPFTTQLIATDIHGCSDTSSATVTTHPNPIANAGNDTSICQGNTAILSATGGNTYHWNNGVNTVSNTVAPVLTSTYYVTATDGNGCIDNDSVVVTINQNTSAYAGNNTVICNGDSATLNASGGISYLWSSGSQTISTTVHPVLTTTYLLAATDNNGCTDTASVVVAVNQNPIADAGNNTAVCFGFSTVLNATGGNTYHWSNGSNSAGITVSPASATFYSVTATDANGCTDKDSVIVMVNQNPVVSITGTNITCYGFNNGIANATVTGGTPNYQFLWSNSQQSEDISSLDTGIYVVVVTDVNNCKGSDSVKITEPSSLVITTSPDQLICNGQSIFISVNAMGGTGIYNYHWSTGDISSQITVHPSINTTYTVFVTDANGCVSAMGNTIVNVWPELNLTLYTTQDSVCPGTPVSITALVSGGNGGPYSLYNVNNELLDMPYIVYPITTSNYVIIAKDGCSISARDTLQIALYPVPNAAFVADKINGCIPLLINFLPLALQSGLQYLWNFGEDQTISVSSTTAHTFENSGTYDITLTVKNQYGCENTETISQMINAYPTPIALFNADPISVSILKPEIEFTNYSEGAINYVWSFGDGDSSNTINPIHSYNNPNKFTVRLVANSIHGCTDTTAMTVIVNDEFTFYAPNYFSPDGDGINDVFKVFGYGIDNNYFKLYIYDRWGELIFISTDIEEGWNGYVGSKMSQNGTYTWLVNFKKISGGSVTKYGAVNLVR